MPDRKSFTLVEMLVVLIILAILAALSIPAYTQQAGANAAQNKLISIYKGELTYYLNNNSYCRNTGPPPHLCGDLVSINTNLLLNIIDTDFTYVCNQGGGPANGFQCTATATSICGGERRKIFLRLANCGL